MVFVCTSCINVLNPIQTLIYQSSLEYPEVQPKKHVKLNSHIYKYNVNRQIVFDVLQRIEYTSISLEYTFV